MVIASHGGYCWRAVSGEATETQGAPPVVRPEIQALRAVAVMTVVVYHLWPDAVPGGFVGVDVFFAISGFLITLHLLREVERSGRVSIPGFWARRARRILPAALVVLAFCAITTITTVPQVHWNQYFKEIRASATYVENWQLASDAIDYQAQDNAPTSVQHFWSLSAEEQFYLVWPVLILLAIVLVARRRPRLPRRGPPRSRADMRRVSIALVLGICTAASLVYSILHTHANPLEAYFVTPARAWEFGAGGLLAVLALRPSRVYPDTRALVSWAGIAAIMITVFTYTNGTPFPSYTALLPIVATLAVIWAGAPEVSWAPTPLMALRPVQFLGDISYSIYLWHWPLLILAPFALNHDLDTATRLSILALTILAAWITKVLVEDPMRSGLFLAQRKARFTFAVAGVATALVLGVAASGNERLERDLRTAQRQSVLLIDSKPRCFGAASRDVEHPCMNPELKHSVVPTPALAANGHNAPCVDVTPQVVIPVCTFGATSAKATKRVAFMGDSHAQSWRAAMRVAALSKGWQGVTVSRTGCGYSEVVKDIEQPARTQCVNWVKRVPRWYEANPDVDTAFVIGFSGATVKVPAGKDPHEAAVKGFMNAWAALPASVKHIIVLQDNPLMKRHGETGACVERAIENKRRAGVACRLSRRRALLPDPAAEAARRLKSPRVQVIDLTPFFCDAKYCYPVIGGALVLKDLDHITRVYASTLGPYIARAYDRLAAKWRG